MIGKAKVTVSDSTEWSWQNPTGTSSQKTTPVIHLPEEPEDPSILFKFFRIIEKIDINHF